MLGKFDSIKKFGVLLGILLVLSIPLNAIAQQEKLSTQEMQEICAQAKADAKRDVNSTLWMGAGCLITWVGVLFAYVIEPSPPASRLLGKSAEYTAVYTDCYKEEAKQIQTSNAIKGAVITLVVYVIGYGSCCLLGSLGGG